MLVLEIPPCDGPLARWKLLLPAKESAQQYPFPFNRPYLPDSFPKTRPPAHSLAPANDSGNVPRVNSHGLPHHGTGCENRPRFRRGPCSSLDGQRRKEPEEATPQSNRWLPSVRTLTVHKTCRVGRICRTRGILRQMEHWLKELFPGDGACLCIFTPSLFNKTQPFLLAHRSTKLGGSGGTGVPHLRKSSKGRLLQR